MTLESKREAIYMNIEQLKALYSQLEKGDYVVEIQFNTDNVEDLSVGDDVVLVTHKGYGYEVQVRE